MIICTQSRTINQFFSFHSVHASFSFSYSIGPYPIQHRNPPSNRTINGCFSFSTRSVYLLYPSSSSHSPLIHEKRCPRSCCRGRGKFENWLSFIHLAVTWWLNSWWWWWWSVATLITLWCFQIPLSFQFFIIANLDHPQTRLFWHSKWRVASCWYLSRARKPR